MKCQLIGNYPDAGKDWRQKEKGTAEDEMVGMDMSLGKLWEIVEDRRAWCVQSMVLQRVAYDLLSNWTTALYGRMLNSFCFRKRMSVAGLWLLIGNHWIIEEPIYLLLPRSTKMNYSPNLPHFTHFLLMKKCFKNELIVCYSVSSDFFLLECLILIVPTAPLCSGVIL